MNTPVKKTKVGRFLVSTIYCDWRYLNQGHWYETAVFDGTFEPDSMPFPPPQWVSYTLEGGMNDHAHWVKRCEEVS